MLRNFSASKAAMSPGALQSGSQILCTLGMQVGDFGLARWQPDGHCGVETRVIGTFG